MGKGEWAKGKESALCLSRFEAGRAEAGLTPASALGVCVCFVFVRCSRAAARPVVSVFDHLRDLSLVRLVFAKAVFFFVFRSPIVGLRFWPRQFGDARHRWPDAVGLYSFDQAKEIKLLDGAIGSQKSLICICAALFRCYDQQIQVLSQMPKQRQILPNK